MSKEREGQGYYIKEYGANKYVEISGAVIQLIDKTTPNIDSIPIYKGRTWSLPLFFASAESHTKIIHNPGAFIKLPLGTAAPTLHRSTPSSSFEDNIIKEGKAENIMKEDGVKYFYNVYCMGIRHRLLKGCQLLNPDTRNDVLTPKKTWILPQRPVFASDNQPIMIRNYGALISSETSFSEEIIPRNLFVALRFFKIIVVYLMKESI